MLNLGDKIQFSQFDQMMSPLFAEVVRVSVLGTACCLRFPGDEAEHMISASLVKILMDANVIVPCLLPEEGENA